MICKNCKRFFFSGNRSDGTPNGVGFVLHDGREITMCHDCLVQLGQMDEKQREEFFNKLLKRIQ